MKIGIAGPIDMTLLCDLFPAHSDIPNTYSFAFTANLARALYHRGHEIVVFSLSREVSITRRIDGDRITAYICPQRLPRYQMLDFFRRERHGLRDAMRTSGCDVIHALWTYEFGSAAVESGLPHAVTAQDIPTVVLRFARHPYWLEKPLLAWPVLRKARCVTAVSPYAADALRAFVKPEREIIVVPNGVTQDTFNLFEGRHRRSEGAPFKFASVLNGWSGRKNGAKLIEAFGILRREFGERVQLIMFGDGHEPLGPAHRWSIHRRLADGVQFVGLLPNGILMNRLAQDVDVLVHPSLEETFGIAVAEAMATGIPVIGGVRSGGIAWVLGNGHAGLLVDVTSPTAIAERMRTVLLDGDLRGVLAQAGRERALKEFHLEAVARKYESVLENARREQTH